MSNYLWVYILAVLAVISLVIFFVSFSKDHFFIKKLKKSKSSYVLNFTFLILSIADILLIVYLFMILKEQIGIFS